VFQIQREGYNHAGGRRYLYFDKYRTIAPIIIIICSITRQTPGSTVSTRWLHAPPITAVGLRLSNEAIRVAVGMRLGINLSEPHQCQCGVVVDARGITRLILP